MNHPGKIQIDDKVIRIGDQIGEYVVKDIEETYVVLQTKNLNSFTWSFPEFKNFVKLQRIRELPGIKDAIYVSCDTVKITQKDILTKETLARIKEIMPNIGIEFDLSIAEDMWIPVRPPIIEALNEAKKWIGKGNIIDVFQENYTIVVIANANHVNKGTEDDLRNFISTKDVPVSVRWASPDLSFYDLKL